MATANSVQKLLGHVLQIEGPMQVARRSDVDMNGHINNVTYIAWALETVPRDVYYNYELQQVPCQPQFMLYSSHCASGSNS